ncbi:hypothetical protein [Cyanobium gracile]|uniref:hypothetical protein n=1 Tax=Cyanobium gracile TaxID=59930 RepID=UPI0012E9C849|nr:hypothetical protein [Cyanobium gracile]
MLPLPFAILPDRRLDRRPAQRIRPDLRPAGAPAEPRLVRSGCPRRPVLDGCAPGDRAGCSPCRGPRPFSGTGARRPSGGDAPRQ